MSKRNSEKASSIKALMKSTGEYLSENRAVILTYVVLFILCSIFALVRIASGTTVSSKALGSYEIGQIADETIIAKSPLPATVENPVTVERGETIIKKGFPVTKEQYDKLRKMAESPAYIDYKSFLTNVLYLMLLTMVFFFLFSKKTLGRDVKLKELILECICFALVYGLVSIAVSLLHFSSSLYLAVILPSSFCVFLVAIIYGHNSAVYFSVLLSLGIFNASGFMIFLFLYSLGTCLISARLVYGISKRSQMVWVALEQAAFNVVVLALLKFILNTPISGDGFSILGVAFNGFISAIVCLGFLTPIELALNSESVFRLLELCDTNSPVLKEMQAVASGTYVHSLNVANLADQACQSIGANALLAKVSAYYHDIGKLKNPEYFTENQQPGDNIHDRISPSMSATILRAHVRDGIKMAKELGLPESVITIISEHHGNQVIEWFYNKAKQLDPNTQPEEYSYMENPPSSRESAVVMLADTVEAACKSLTKEGTPSYGALDKKITELINKKIADHQLDNSDITLKDLKAIHDSFLHFLEGHYHSRIKYPGQENSDAENAPGQMTPSREPSLSPQPEPTIGGEVTPVPVQENEKNKAGETEESAKSSKAKESSAKKSKTSRTAKSDKKSSVKSEKSEKTGEKKKTRTAKSAVEKE
ncbi:MAG: HDIG domain-containing protein [Treponema sp.]|nr:HDIG domain-containing protein [Treponema sp.]